MCVPLHRDAWHAIQRVTVIGRMLIGAGVVGLVALVITGPSPIGGGLAVAALLAGLVTEIAVEADAPARSHRRDPALGHARRRAPGVPQRGRGGADVRAS